MSHWEAMKRCVGKDADEIADELNLEYSTIRRWTRPYEGPTDTGARGPGEVLYKTVRKSRELGRAPDDAFAPLDEIETLLGRVCIETIPIDKNLPDLALELGKTMKESGEALAVSAKAFADNRLSSREKAEIIKESKEALRQWASYIISMEKAI